MKTKIRQLACAFIGCGDSPSAEFRAQYKAAQEAAQIDPQMNGALVVLNTIFPAVINMLETGTDGEQGIQDVRGISLRGHRIVQGAIPPLYVDISKPWYPPASSTRGKMSEEEMQNRILKVDINIPVSKLVHAQVSSMGARLSELGADRAGEPVSDLEAVRMSLWVRTYIDMLVSDLCIGDVREIRIADVAKTCHMLVQDLNTRQSDAVRMHIICGLTHVHENTGAIFGVKSALTAQGLDLALLLETIDGASYCDTDTDLRTKTAIESVSLLTTLLSEYCGTDAVSQLIHQHIVRDIASHMVCAFADWLTAQDKDCIALLVARICQAALHSVWLRSRVRDCCYAHMELWTEIKNRLEPVHPSSLI